VAVASVEEQAVVARANDVAPGLVLFAVAPRAVLAERVESLAEAEALDADSAAGLAEPPVERVEAADEALAKAWI
jgi:hypothetical protein